MRIFLQPTGLFFNVRICLFVSFTREPNMLGEIFFFFFFFPLSFLGDFLHGAHHFGMLSGDVSAVRRVELENPLLCSSVVAGYTGVADGGHVALSKARRLL